MFCCGATKSAVAALKDAQSWAWSIFQSACGVRSSSVSHVASIARMSPPPSPARSEITGPWRVARTIAHADRFLPRREGESTAGRQIAMRVRGIGLFDEEILDIGAGGGEAPGDMPIVADDDEGRSGCRHPGTHMAGRLDAREIPDAGRREIEMRII